MLRAYNAKHLSLGMGELEGPEYQQFYEKAIQEIGRMVRQRR